MINGHAPLNINYYTQWVEALKKSEIHKHAELYRPITDDSGFPCMRVVMNVHKTQDNPPRHIRQEYLIAINIPPTDGKHGIVYLTNLVLEDIAHAGK